MIDNILDFKGLEYYDGKTVERTDAKIAVETERAKSVEDTKIDSVKIGTTEYKSGTTVTLPVYVKDEIYTKEETDSTFASDISLSINTSTYKMTLDLKNNDGQVLASKEIDFPIESMVVNATYENKILTLTLQNGNTLDVDISDIISGLVPDTRTIAGIDLKDDVTATELRTALNVANGAEVNQNAFSNVKVGSTTVSADTKTDTLTLVAGDNVAITVDADGDEITISSSHSAISKSTDTTSTASPSAGESFTTIDSVTRDYNGHVTKINTKTVTLPTTLVTIDSALSATSTNPVQNNVVTQALNGKQSTITGAISTLVSDNLNPNYVPVSNSKGKVVSSDIKTTELNYLSGVSSNIQTQLNNKQNNLGFTPIQQGGGSGQSTNKIYIGWTGSQLNVQVDATNFGGIAFKSDITTINNRLANARKTWWTSFSSGTVSIAAGKSADISIPISSNSSWSSEPLTTRITGTNCSFCMVYDQYLSDDRGTCHVYVRNLNTSEAANVTVTVRIFYFCSV